MQKLVVKTDPKISFKRLLKIFGSPCFHICIHISVLPGWLYCVSVEINIRAVHADPLMVKWGLIFGWDEGCGYRNLPPTHQCLPSSACCQHCVYVVTTTPLATAHFWGFVSVGVLVCVCVCPWVCVYTICRVFKNFFYSESEERPSTAAGAICGTSLPVLLVGPVTVLFFFFFLTSRGIGE